ncbi:MAG: replicative helicase [Caulobacteraceae bacterium]|nr:replicative helicase [Caulobacteraceae bacterium]
MAEAQILDLRRRGGDEVALALESAQALIGCVLSDPTRLREVANIRPDHFAEAFHGRLWGVIVDLIEGGREPDLATIIDRIGGDAALADLGGREFLFNLWEKAPAPALARQFAENVMDAFARREGAEMLSAAARALMGSGERRASVLISEIRQSLEGLERDGSECVDELVNAEEAAEALVDALDDEAVNGRERGAMTGLRCFDRRLRGLRPGWLIVIGGRPSMAKSGLARAAAYGCAARNPDAAALFFSLEMDRRECAERALSAASFMDHEGIAYSQFGGGLSSQERATLRRLRQAMPTNVLIDDRSTIGLDDIRRRVWAVKARRPVAAVFIDYLQLMEKPAGAGRNEALVLGDITRGLKILAREAETCVVLLSQLNRSVESRDDKRPQLADLRDSGSIEQDANAVLFPFRPAYYTEREEPKDAHSSEHAAWQARLESERRRMDVIAAKVRGGAIGTDRQLYFAEFDHVEDLPE